MSAGRDEADFASVISKSSSDALQSKWLDYHVSRNKHRIDLFSSQ